MDGSIHYLLISVDSFVKLKLGLFNNFFKQKPEDKIQIFNSFFLEMFSDQNKIDININFKKVMSYKPLIWVVNNCGLNFEID